MSVLYVHDQVDPRFLKDIQTLEQPNALLVIPLHAA
jgi:hypothetical protein